ncbi:MAG: GAF domain-containing protein [Nitrospirae bacterium]|nr:GAF domain-containing protein [Nitrospirota bacterium]
MRQSDKVKVAIVGAGREGLDTLALLKKEHDVSLSMLLDPDRDALGFRLEEYGYRYADDLNVGLSHRLQALSSIQDLSMVIDTVPDKYHKDLYTPGIHTAEIINGYSARFIWELKSINDIEKRRPLISERFNKALEEVKRGLLSAPQAHAVDEPGALILRASFLGTHAAAAQLTILQRDEGYKIIRDTNVESSLLIQKGCVRRYLKDGDESDKIIRYVVENKSPYEGEASNVTKGITKGLNAFSVIPLIEEGDVVGMLWFFYNSSDVHFMKDDNTFILSLTPLFGRPIRDAIESERSRLAYVEDTLSTGPLNTIGSEKPIGQRLKEVNLALSELLEAEDAHLYVKDPVTCDLVLQATTCKFPSLLGRIRVKKGTGVLSEVIERRNPLALTETNIGDGNATYRFARREDSITLLYIPLIVKDEGVGIISMEFINIHNLTPKTFRTLEDIGGHLANTISSDAERRRMSQKIIKLSVVNEEGIELLSTVDLQKIYALATASSAMLLDSEASVLRLYEDGRLVVRSTYGLHDDKISQTLLDIESDVSATVSQTRIPVIIHDLPEYAEVTQHQDFPYKTAMALPVIYDKELLGTLSLYNKAVSEVFSSLIFSEDDREIAERFIQYVARGVINARRYSERQSLIIIDEVTGLRNERYLQMRFPEEIKRAKRYNRCLSLIFLEVRPFDEDVIRDLSKIVKDTFRYIDVLVRLKDAKFAILLPDTGEGVKEAANRVAANFGMLKEKIAGLSLYMGYSTFPDDSEDMQELIKKASKLRQY